MKSKVAHFVFFLCKKPTKSPKAFSNCKVLASQRAPSFTMRFAYAPY